ncbi:MAG: glyoxalase [Zetaproteobacteria bacterium CG_4_9_14_3_um_filter_49_83]|nr:MAG: glyoxalase [Zetaproteobacteria bacterium CG17_big_fil_post_rev_8_21_14_2_50_50_13]PIV31633.1 MAG: glyoxalase [Zetaproteobacteria bacterium CG02_land_8_20_14_3_00_50_9]PIY55766.1 MAG: glyoxalase [Zetaproteobacteria bacterium CG_4_10_14_0_8_um_filter_49_80]PJA35086.1 MAG: glyoxalase [Zetaproteobacteria bacterium CG_4_9_14_3_um_filter_49_83]
MKIAHVGLLVSDLDVAVEFYVSVLKLKQDKRPNLGFQGVFLSLDDGQQLHLMQLDNPYAACELPTHGGRDRHVALAVACVSDIQARLDAAGITYSKSKSGRDAIFLRDPDGNSIELVAE